MEKRGLIANTQLFLEKVRRCLQSISVYTITFMTMDEVHTRTTVEVTEEEAAMDGAVDEELTNYLTDKRAINWCRNTSKMAALKINSRGRSSLLKAVSKSIWAVEDRNTETFLQQLMDMNLSSARESARFKERWENETFKRSNRKRASEFLSWEEVCRAFKDDDGVWDSRTGDVDCIHVFTLANIVKRPIIVVEADENDYEDDKPDENDGLCGLYLPCLMSPEHCFKSPIVLASRNGRFSPVVISGEEANKPSCRQTLRIRAVPLVSCRFEPLRIRNLADEESWKQEGYGLIHDYLKLEEIPCTGPKTLNQVLSARLTCQKPELFDDDAVFEACSNGSGTCRKFSGTCCAQINNEEWIIPGSCGLGVNDSTRSRSESSGLRQFSAAELSSKRRTSENDSLKRKDELFLVRTNSELSTTTSKGVEEFGNSESCIVPNCTRRGAADYDGRCSYCYVMGTDVSPLGQSFGSGGLKSSEELSRERLDLQLVENGGRTPPRKTVVEVEETRYERQFSEQPKCSVPICENVGLMTYNGLCIECFNTLWKAKETGTNQSTGIRANIAKVTGPTWSSGVPPHSTRSVATKAKCLTDGCHLPVDDENLGLCKSCFKQQLHVLEAFERQKDTGVSRRSSSSGSQRPSETYEGLFPQGQTLPGAPRLPGVARTKQTASSYQRINREPTTRAKMCLSVHCDRFGDPGFGGFCSVCYVKRN